MATAVSDQATRVGAVSEPVTGAVAIDDGKATPRLSSAQIWHELANSSFAVVSYVTPAGEPRSSGVVYKTIGGRLCAAIAPDSWKARYVVGHAQVSVTVPVRRGGLLSLVLPIPPATVSFHGTAKIHPAGSAEARSALKALAPLLPPERRDTGSILEITPEGAFLTYGLRVSLIKMLDPTAARARVPVN